jgi:hypothetical protein
MFVHKRIWKEESQLLARLAEGGEGTSSSGEGGVAVEMDPIANMTALR